MTERASRDNLFAVCADNDWKSNGLSFDFEETSRHLFDPAEAPDEAGAEGELVFGDLSDYGILDDFASDGFEAEDGEDLIEPLRAEALDVSVDIEADSEVAAPLDAEIESEDEDLLKSDDDEFASVTGLAAEEVDSPDVQPEGPEGVNFVGTDGDDVFVGSALTDILDGREGDDVLTGLAGKDYLIGYDGNDTLFGGDGEDELAGGTDADIIYGGQGSDFLSGNEGNDTLCGGAGDDLYFWQRGDGDDLVIDEGRLGSNVFELKGIMSDQVQFSELENGDWQLIIAASAPDANDGGIITFQAGSFETFAPLQFFNPVPSEEYGAMG